MAWQNVYGSWRHDPGVQGDVIMAGGKGWNNFPGNPPGSPGNFGRGVCVESVGKNTYRFRLSLVAYAISVSTGKYFVSVYQGGRDTDYQWIIKASISYDNVTDPKQGKYTQLFQENFKTMYHGGDPLYGNNNWHNKAYENTTSNTFKATRTDVWIRLEIYGEPAVKPLYAYFRLDAALLEFRAWAIRKQRKWLSLDRSSGFFRKRKNGQWVDVPKMSYDSIGKENKGTSRIRKKGKMIGQNKIGE